MIIQFQSCLLSGRKSKIIEFRSLSGGQGCGIGMKKINREFSDSHIDVHCRLRTNSHKKIHILIPYYTIHDFEF